MIKLIHGDCLEEMKKIEDNSIDMILCDLPYGTTACKWDTVINFDLLWKQYKRIIKDNAAIVLFGSQPFTSKLVCSNIKWFRYEWIWEKSRPSNIFLSKKMPLKYHENICVFYNKLPKYNPIMWKGKKNHKGAKDINKIYISNHINSKRKNVHNTSDLHYPKSIQNFKSLAPQKIIHPTQKPILLLEYLLKTYTDKNDLVLDNCMGSGSTGIAAKNLKRSFIGIEKDETYYKIAKERIENYRSLL